MKLPHKDPTGFFTFLHNVVRNQFGAPGKWGHGRYPHLTAKGPGIRHAGKRNPAGTKLVRRFIRNSRGEQLEYRRDYAERTGRQYGEKS